MTPITPRVAETLGMSTTELSIYSEVIRFSEIHAADLHRKIGLNRSRMYTVLSEMVTKGLLIERTLGRRRYYKAVRPSELKNILKNQHKIQLETTKDVFKELNVFHDLHRDSDVGISAKIEILNNGVQAHRRYMELLAEAKDSLETFVRPPFVAMDETLRIEQDITTKAAINRGVKVKSLVMHNSEDWEWISSVLQKMDITGGETRVTDSLPFKQFIIDRNYVILSFPSHDETHINSVKTVIIRDSGFIQVAVELFNSYWNNGKSLKEFSINS